MFKNNISFFLFLFISFYALAQSGRVTITGNVRTDANDPVEFVSVALKGTRYGTVTNLKGHFKFDAPVGEYTMVVTALTVKINEFPVSIKKEGPNHYPDIIVEEKSMSLGEVVITGQLTPQSLENSIYKVRVISSKDIEEKGANDVQSLLNTEIGVRMSNDMALGETDFEIMGMSGNNVKVLIDGVPIIDRLDKKQSLNQIDVNTIERVEIVEGPMSVMYGTDALAGVINIITKKGKKEDNKRLSVGAKIQEETLGKKYHPFYKEGLHIQNLSARYIFDNGLFGSATLTHNEFGGWQGDLTGRRKEWPSKEQYLGSFQFGLDKKNASLSYKLAYMNENVLRRGDIPLNKKALDEEFIANRYTHLLNGHWQLNKKVRLTLATSYQDYQRDKRSTVIDFANGNTYLSTAEGAQDESAYSVWFGRLTATYRILGNLSLQPGIEFQQNQGAGDKMDSAHNTITNAAIFLSAEYSPLSWLDIRPGVRSTYNSKYDAPLAIPSINIKTKLNKDMDLRLSYARGFRAPSLQELYYTFYHTNGGGFWIKGNPLLQAEKSDSYMASYVWRILSDEKLRLLSTLSGFYNDFKDRIQMVQSANESSVQTYYNTGKYKTLGVTFENSLIWNDLKVSVNVSYIGRYNTFFNKEEYAVEKQDRMRYSPEVSANLTYNWTKIATFHFFYKFTGARQEYKESDNQLVLGGLSSYHWADLTISRPLTKFLHISAGVKNIFDITTVENITGGGSYGASTSSLSLMGCGRSYFIGLSFKLNK